MSTRGPELTDLSDDELRTRVDEFPIWYHTIDLRPGIETPGAFDLRGVREDLPWVDVTGKRCLDVGTFDGFWAIEMERRGAAEVVAVDVEDPRSYDWPEILSPDRLGGIKEGYDHGTTGDRFQFVQNVLQSKVERRICSIYDLDPDEFGTFDVVFCSSLLLHLRDPMRALAALRSVCSGHLMTNDPIDLRQSLMNPRQPVARFDGVHRLEWWTPNAIGQQRMLESAGLEIVERKRPVMMPYRVPPPTDSLRQRLTKAGNWLLTRSTAPGVLQQPILSRPI